MQTPTTRVLHKTLMPTTQTPTTRILPSTTTAQSTVGADELSVTDTAPCDAGLLHDLNSGNPILYSSNDIHCFPSLKNNNEQQDLIQMEEGGGLMAPMIHGPLQLMEKTQITKMI